MEQGGHVGNHEYRAPDAAVQVRLVTQKVGDLCGEERDPDHEIADNEAHDLDVEWILVDLLKTKF